MAETSVFFFMSCENLFPTALPNNSDSNTNDSGFRSILNQSGSSLSSPRLTAPVCFMRVLRNNNEEEIVTERQRSRNPYFHMGVGLTSSFGESGVEEEIHFHLAYCEGNKEFDYGEVHTTFTALAQQNGFIQFPIELTLETGGFEETSILKLHFIQVHSQAHPLLANRVVNNLVRLYQYNNTKVVALEEASEVEMSISIPLTYLMLNYQVYQQQYEHWRHLYNKKRLQKRHFQSNVEALDHHNQVFRIAVIQAKNLTPPPFLVDQQQSQKEQAGASNANQLFSRWKKKAETWGRQTDYNQKFKSLNPYVILKLLHSSFSRDLMIGRTNTEYEVTNQNPIWNSNLKATKYAISTLVPTRVELLNEGGFNTKEFVFFLPYEKSTPQETEERVLEFGVYQEAVGLISRKEHILLGSVYVSLKNLEECMTVENYEGIESRRIEIVDWFPIVAHDSEKSVIGQLQLRLHLIQPLVPADSPSPQNDKEEYDLSFLYRHVIRMEKNLESIAEMIQIYQHKLQKNDTDFFKSSKLKGNRELQSIPTNLHLSYFNVFTTNHHHLESAEDLSSVQDLLQFDEVETTGDGGWSLQGGFCTVTGGAPTAHAMGLTDHGLREIEMEMDNLQKKIYADQQSKLDINDSGNNAVVDEDSIANQYSMVNSSSDLSMLVSSSYEEREEEVQKKPSHRSSIAKKLFKKNLDNNSPSDKNNASNNANTFERLQALKQMYIMRKMVAQSQSLSICVTCFLSHIEKLLLHHSSHIDQSFHQLTSVGFLIGWESLISSQGKELRMLSDAWVAIHSLKEFSFQLRRELNPSCITLENDGIKDGYKLGILNQNENQFVIQISVQSTLVSRFPSFLFDNQSTIEIIPVLFTQGINEMQTLANVMGHAGNSLQSSINQSSFRFLQQYYRRFFDFKQKYEPHCSDMTPAMVAKMEKILNNLMVVIQEETMNSKDTAILLHASDLVRCLNGARITYCKSGKDRTAMSVTLEQARLLDFSMKKMTHDDEHDQLGEVSNASMEIANVMREYGVRLEIAKKNVGRKAYSFNSIQRQLLPEMYRPPPSTIQNLALSVAARDS